MKFLSPRAQFLESSPYLLNFNLLDPAMRSDLNCYDPFSCYAYGWHITFQFDMIERDFIDIRTITNEAYLINRKVSSFLKEGSKCSYQTDV